MEDDVFHAYNRAVGPGKQVNVQWALLYGFRDAQYQISFKCLPKVFTIFQYWLLDRIPRGEPLVCDVLVKMLQCGCPYEYDVVGSLLSTAENAESIEQIETICEGLSKYCPLRYLTPWSRRIIDLFIARGGAVSLPRLLSRLSPTLIASHIGYLVDRLATGEPTHRRQILRVLGGDPRIREMPGAPAVLPFLGSIVEYLDDPRCCRSVLRILASFHASNVLPFLGLVQDLAEKSMEYESWGTLFECIDVLTKHPEAIWQIAPQLMDALRYDMVLESDVNRLRAVCRHQFNESLLEDYSEYL